MFDNLYYTVHYLLLLNVVHRMTVLTVVGKLKTRNDSALQNH